MTQANISGCWFKLKLHYFFFKKVNNALQTGTYLVSEMIKFTFIFCQHPCSLISFQKSDVPTYRIEVEDSSNEIKCVETLH